MSKLAADLQLAFRGLRKSPGFTLAVVLTLALGIGASVAVFSVFSAVLLEPLPYRQPDGLVMMWSRWKDFPDKTWISPSEYALYRQEVKSFAAIAAFDLGTAALT